MRSRALTRYLAAAALAALLLTDPARAQLLYSIGDGPTLRVIDAATSATVSGPVPITLPGTPVLGGFGLARHPTTGELWALLSLTQFGFESELVTLDRCTGIATSRGTVGNFYSLAFDDEGTLYSVSGLFTPVHSSLYVLQTGGSPDPAFVVTMSLGTHHALAFSPDDGLLYHGAPGLLESVNPTTLAITSVPFSGDFFAALMGSLVYAGDGVLYTTGGLHGAFDRITTQGVVTNLPPLDHNSWQLALVGTDAPCPTTTTTSTSSSSTTTTTLAGGCGPVPRPDCVGGEDGLLEIDERKPGRERLAASVRRLAEETGSAELGDPIGGASAYDTCVYDQAGTLVGALRVDRAGATCGSKPCWKPIKSIGARYGDEQGSADGVVKLVVRGGAPGRGALVIRAANRPAAGMTSLPTGLAAALAGTGSATIQVVVSDGACLAATLPTVRVADGMRFKARLR
jgi:hypothetical protein